MRGSCKHTCEPSPAAPPALWLLPPACAPGGSWSPPTRPSTRQCCLEHQLGRCEYSSKLGDEADQGMTREEMTCCSRAPLQQQAARALGVPEMQGSPPTRTSRVGSAVTLPMLHASRPCCLHAHTGHPSMWHEPHKRMRRPSPRPSLTGPAISQPCDSGSSLLCDCAGKPRQRMA